MSKGHKISVALVTLGIIYLIVLSLLDISSKLQIGLTYLVIPLGLAAGIIFYQGCNTPSRITLDHPEIGNKNEEESYE